jgi:hypothetical protein
MGNGGWYGTREEWDRVEKPLLEIDPVICKLAHAWGLRVLKNAKDWPSRSMQWGGDVRCLIQIWLANQDQLTWNIWICCSQDRDGERYWRTENLIEGKCLSDFKDGLSETLTAARERLIAWSERPEELTFATKLGDPSQFKIR